MANTPASTENKKSKQELSLAENINIPLPEKVNTSDLKTDGCNPNKMTKEQHERLATSIKKWGFIVPIITNKDYLIADGEQRWSVAKSLGMSQVLVIRLPVEEVDRRLLRQVLNKLRGEHDRQLDAEEFNNIIQLGGEEELKYLLNLSDEKLDGYIKEEEPIDYEKQYQIAIDCENEIQQEALYTKLTSEGYKCHPLTL